MPVEHKPTRSKRIYKSNIAKYKRIKSKYIRKISKKEPWLEAWNPDRQKTVQEESFEQTQEWD